MMPKRNMQAKTGMGGAIRRPYVTDYPAVTYSFFSHFLPPWHAACYNTYIEGSRKGQAAHR